MFLVLPILELQRDTNRTSCTAPDCRSRSPHRDSRRDDRDRYDRDRERGERDRHREERDRQRDDRPPRDERPRDREAPPAAPAVESAPPASDEPVTLEGLDDADLEMMREMGLPVEFGTTKGQKHDDASAYKLKTTREARQYMNRRGGFNRPLPAEKTGVKLNQF